MACDERPGDLAGGAPHLTCVPSFEAWPATLEVASPRFVLLVVADAAASPDAAILQAARRALASGACFVCVWGPDCERVHDLFDRVIVDEGLEGACDGDVIMTTWHASETLEETIRFFLVAAGPAEVHRATCRARVAVVVGPPDDLAARVRRALADPAATLAAWESADDDEGD